MADLDLPAPRGARARVFDWTTRLSLLASNLTPLALILAIIASRSFGIWFWIFTVATAIGIATTIWMLVAASGQSRTVRRVKEVSDAGGEVAGYLVSYTLPFLAVSATDWYIRLAFLVFALVLILVFLNSNLLAVSPLLYLFGYALHRVKFDQEPDTAYFTISRHRPLVGKEITVVKWGALLIRSKGDDRGDSPGPAIA